MHSITTLKAQNEQIDCLLSQYQVSWHKKVTFTQNLQISTLKNIFGAIRSSEELKQSIKVLRTMTDEELQKKYKKYYIPYFNLGTFYNSHRKDENLISTSFFIFDYDYLGNDLNAIKEKNKACKNVFAQFISPRGNGLKVIYRLGKPLTNHILYSRLYKYYAEKFNFDLGAEPDKTSDASRPCYFSYDPDIYINTDSEPLDTDIKLDMDKKSTILLSEKTDVDYNLLTKVIEFLRTKAIRYNDWIGCGFALATLGENGRAFFMRLSDNSNYNDTDYEINAKYNNLLKNITESSDLDTIYFIAARYGYKFINFAAEVL